jgi:UDP-N-acetylmuramate--alanine ligase
MSEELKIQDIKKAYFLGIGGIGMSALVRYFKSIGIYVAGYDRTPTTLTGALQEEGIPIHFEDNPGLFPADTDIVVYTPAIPSSNQIFVYCQTLDLPILKRSDVLQLISRNSYNICIAGTHGKTTTTAMVGHLLRHSGYGCNAFLGGISTNYNTNFWSHPNNVCVIEADEYDRSFLKLNPDIISISSMDPDHLDIYGTPEAMEEAFIQFTQQLKESGLLLSKKGLKKESAFKASRHFTFSADNKTASIHVSNCEVIDGAYVYNVKGSNWELKGITLKMGGLHNVENSLVAIAIGKYLGIADQKIQEALATFRGVKRRFEYVYQSQHHVFIDDYAHHPEELTALIKGVRSMFPEKTCTLIFQPHLYSRTRDFAAAFAQALDLADKLVLLPIYPARELPIPGIDSSIIANHMKKEVELLDLDQVTQWVSKENPMLIITAGAGNIDTLIDPIKQVLKAQAC